MSDVNGNVSKGDRMGHNGDTNMPAARPRAIGGRLSVHSMNFNIPTVQGTNEHAIEKHGPDSWRYKVLKFLHSGKVQILLMALLFLDVIILFIELLFLASFPHCSVIVRDAISCCPATATADHDVSEHGDVCTVPGTEPAKEYEAGCDEHKWEAVHTTEEVLFAMTITILSLFMLELTISMIALTPQIFFRQFFFLLDFFIISVSLALELTFHFFNEDIYQSLAGVLVFIRIWRFVRIGHGIIEITNEVAHKDYMELLSYAELLRDVLRENRIPLPPDADGDRFFKSELEDGNLLSAIQGAERKKLRKPSDNGVGSSGEQEQPNASVVAVLDNNKKPSLGM